MRMTCRRGLTQRSAPRFVLSTLTARVFSHRASGQGGVAVLEVTGAKGASQAGTKARVTTSTAAPAPASPAAATARQVEKAESAVPATSRIVRPSVAPAKVASGTCGSGGSSRALTAALEKAGHIKPPGAAVHHIVARTAKKAREAREVLQKYGIDMDDAVNGVFLPAARKSPNPASASVHSTLHTDKYYKAVNELLLEANTRAEVVERLAEIRAQLLAGTMVR
jgi:antitoxin component of RelBE/YafQ-DinJ toxin-antitoxin module